jgi:hypothetical protein
MTKLATRLRDRLRSERGMAVPTALMVIVIGLGLSGAAVMATVSAQHGSIRDQDRKAAIAASDAGISQALFRQNKISTQTEPCLMQGSAGGLVPGAPLADGWCPEQTGSVGDASYAYRVMPAVEEVPLPGQQGKSQTTVVSVGTSDDVSRRAAVRAVAPTGQNVFGADRAIGVDSVEISGESDVNVSTGSNGTVTVDNNATLCGDGRHGPGGDLVFDNNGVQCPGYGENEGMLEVPPPDLSAVTFDSTVRFFGQDLATGNVTWDPSTRTLDMDGAATLSLNGGDYILCKLEMGGGSTLIAAAGSHVRIFFDKPENCGWTSGDTAQQIKVTGTSSIIRTVGADMPQLLMAGSDQGIRSEAYFSGTGDVLNQFILYAPRTHVTIEGTATYQGAVAGQTLYVGGTAILTADQDLDSPDVQVTKIYRPDRYVECIGATGSPPDADC